MGFARSVTRMRATLRALSAQYVIIPDIFTRINRPSRSLAGRPEMATATFTKREERENESNAASKAAYEVTRKYAVRLCSCFAVRDLVIRLYADSLIDQVTFEKWANPSSSPTESATMILLDVQRSVSLQNDGISKLCSILSESDEDTAEVAKDIEGN